MNNQMYIVKQYFKITFRNLNRFKIQSFTAVFGLAFALLCFVPALYWMYYETTYDGFYPDADQICRIYSVEKQSGKINERVPGILGKKLLKQFPVIESSTDFICERLDYNNIEKTYYTQLNTICADTAFFRVFPQECVIGDMQQALQVAGNMVLTETIATRLFGSVEKAIEQKLENSLSRIFGSCTVTAVVKDPPLNTNLPFDALLNYPALQDASMIMPEAEQWSYFNNNLYVKIHSHTDIDGLAIQLRDFTSQINVNPNIELNILPIKEVRHHLNTNLPFTFNFIQLLVVAGILLMLSALFNFLNLYLGLFLQRVHEFRQRMVYGATNFQIILQMMFEQTCIALVALLLGGCFISLVSPLLANLLGIVMDIPLLLRFSVLCSLITLLCLFVANLIPLLNLNRLIMKNLSMNKTSRKSELQRIAISLQFAVSIVFIVAVSVIMMQMRFISQKDLGFDPDGIIQLYSANAKLANNKAALTQKLEAIPQVVNISTTSFEPGQNVRSDLMTSEVEWPGKDDLDKSVFQWIPVGDKFAETFDLELLKGRWWGKNENKKIVLNEEAVRVMGLNEHPIGTVVRISPFFISIDGLAPMEEYEVIGVVRNFPSLSFRSPIYPSILRPGMEDIWYIRVVSGQEQEVIQQINSILPSVDVCLTDNRLMLLNELYDHLNYSEQVGLKLFSILAIVSLLISLFGIYAVATTATQRRRKEIAIRKIAGAGTKDIINLFFREYTILILVAGFIALPLAYYVMAHWLQRYAYHINIPLWLLAAILGGIILIVLFTVFGQVLKAANGNLAKVVKNE